MDSGKVDYVDIQVFMPLFGVKKKRFDHCHCTLDSILKR